MRFLSEIFTCDILAARIISPSNDRAGCAPAAAIVPICGRSSMATRLGWLGKASAQVTRLMTSLAEAIAGANSFVTSLGEALVQWPKKRGPGTIRFGASALEALVHWLKVIGTGDVIVVAEMKVKVENLGTEQVPVDLPKIKTKHDFLLFDYVGQ